MSGKLYTPAKYYRAYRIQIAAKYSGFELQTVPYVFGETDKDKNFLQKFPSGTAPAFESNDGAVHLFEVNAIARYVGHNCPQLCGGSDTKDRALVSQWVNWADSHLAPAIGAWVFPCLGASHYNKVNNELAKENVFKALKMLEEHMSSQTFIAIERITLADITLFCNLLPLIEHALDPQTRERFPHLMRWFTTVKEQPEVLSVVSEVNFCEKEMKYDPKRSGDHNRKNANHVKSKKGRHKDDSLSKKSKSEAFESSETSKGECRL